PAVLAQKLKNLCVSGVDTNNCCANFTRNGIERVRSALYGFRMPSHPPIGRVLFDESHAESWTVRPEVAREMQPSHPADSSYARAAEALRERSLAVEPFVEGPLTAVALSEVAVLVIAHPSGPKWERTM